MEQIDMLFDPVFQEDQQNSEVMETNNIIDTRTQNYISIVSNNHNHRKHRKY